MYFESFRDLLLMDGHGGFVWSAYLIVLVVLAILVSVPLARSRSVLRRVRSRARARAGENTLLEE